MFKGLRTVIYPVPDIAAGKAWYAEMLDLQPYYDQPYYVGFEVGGFEIGLIPDREAGATGTEAYWGVDNVETELARLLALGAQAHQPVKDVGEGVRVATVLDPFGNLLGIIENPMFDPAKVK